jgi:DNA-binding Lrp family transcriptional regulator
MKLDKIDVKLLHILQKDARKSFREIAKELDTSTPTVSNKISILEDAGVIKGYHADIDADILGEGSIILIIKTSPSDIEKTTSEMQELENVTECYVLSNSRIFLKVTLLNPADINNFLAELSKIENIQEYDYYSIIETKKESHRAVIEENLSISLQCFYCKKVIFDEPVKLKLDGKVHYLCCNTCAKHFKEKYEKLKSNV